MLNGSEPQNHEFNLPAPSVGSP